MYFTDVKAIFDLKRIPVVVSLLLSDLERSLMVHVFKWLRERNLIAIYPRNPELYFHSFYIRYTIYIKA